MAERYGADLIDYILSNDSTVTAIVGTSIYEGNMVPSSDNSKDTINYYRTDIYSGGTEWFESRFSVDCRADDYTTSRDLASNAFTALNREFATVNSKYYFTRCEILTTIPPVNKTDVYNTPVSVYLRRK